MKLSGCPQVLLVLAILVCASSVSCDHRASTTKKLPAKPAAEESLDQIMEVFRRRVEDTPIGFVATDSVGRSAMTGTNKVSYELIRPAADGEPYKAVVTVASQAHYSILRTTEGPKEEGRDGKSQKEPSAGTLDETEADLAAFDAGEQVADDKSKKKNSPARAGEETVTRQKVEEVRKYELIYDSGRWRLVTKLDEQTERAIENAFSNALGIQI